MPLYSIPLPNGVIVDIEGPDTPETAMQAQTRARQYFREAYPEEFETWRQRQVGIWNSAKAGTSSGIDQAQALGYGAAEGLGELVNLPGLAAWGRQGRIRNEIEAEAAFPSELRTGILDVTGPGSFARAATELVTQSLPQTVAALGGAAAGVALAPSAPLLAAIGGAAATQYPLFVGSNIARKTQVDAEQRGVPAEEGRVTSPGAAFLAAVPQSITGAATDVFTGRVAGLFGGAAGKAAGTAGASAGQRVLRTGAAGAGSNAIGEPIEQAFERGQAGLSLTDAEAGREYLEAGLGGAVAGGITGGALGGVFGQRPAPPPAAEIGTPAGFQPPTPPAEQPAPRFQPLTLPERPAPFASMEEAADYATANNLELPQLATPEASSNWISAQREAKWQEQVDKLRQQAINEFIAAPKADEAVANPQAQVSELLTNLAEAQGRGDINLNRFSPNGVAKAALSLRDIDPGKPTPDELSSITRQLDSLVDLGYLNRKTVQETKKPESGKGKATKRTSTFYSINTNPVVAPTQQEAPAAPATAPGPAYDTWEQQSLDVGAAVLSPEENITLARGQTDEAVRESPAYQEAFQKFTDARSAWVAQNPAPTPEAPAAPAAPEAPAPAAPAPEVPPATASQLWQAYALNAGPHTSNPIVRDAREAAKARGRGFARQEFDSFANQYGAAPVSRPANLRDTDGWKLHIGTEGQTPQQIERLTQELNRLGVPFKQGLNSGQTGKDFTIYVGSRAEAERIARQLSPLTNGRVYGDAALDDVEMAPGVGARFDVVGDKDFHQYGKRGIPILRDLIDIGQPFSDDAIQRSEATLANRYGEFFTGQKAAPQATSPEAAPAEAVQPSAASVAEGVQPNPESLIAAPPITNMAKAKELTGRQFDDQMRWWYKWFGSSIMTIPSVNAFFRAVGDLQYRFYTRKNEAITATMPGIEPIAMLPPESRGKVTLALQEASSRQAAPDRAAFSQEEYTAMESVWKSVQRSLDFLIDGYVQSYFDPKNATDPQVRAKLEAFQQAKGDRLVTDMPAEEVRAASEKGYQEIQKYNRMRNPYYFPQISNGSHFVAAYERKPGGREDLVRIYFYDPIGNVRKKLPGMRDPEQRALEFLRQEFQDNPNVRIMGRGVPAENDQSGRAQKVRDQGDFVAKYLKDLTKVSGKEGRQIIERMFAEIDKAQMDRVFRKNSDTLRAVTPDNAADYAVDTLPKYLMSMAAIQARRYTQDDFVRATRDMTPNDRKYWEDLRDYSSTAGEAYGTARAFVFFSLLGFAVDTAAINLMQGPFVTFPRLMRDGGAAATKHYSSALKDTLLTGDLLKLVNKDMAYTQAVIKRRASNADEVAALQKALNQGVLTPVFTSESRGQVSADTLRRAGIPNATAWASRINKLADWAGRFMQAVEEFNRVSGFLAAYRLAKANPKAILDANYVDNKKMQTPFDYASDVVNSTHFLTQKEDRALIQRFRPEAEVATQFMSFPLKMVEQFARQGSMMIRGMAKADPVLAKAGALGFMGLLVPLVGVAGIWALPFADSLREIFERLMKGVFGNPTNLKVEMDKLLQGQTILGYNLGPALNNGLAHVSGVASLSKRIGIDPMPAQDFLSNPAFALLGPFGSFAERTAQAYAFWEKGDPWGTIANLPILPRAAGNVVKGTQLAVEGEMRTSRGTTVISPDIVQRADANTLVPSSIRQGIGLPPPAFTDARETAALRNQLETQMNSIKANTSARLAQIYVAAMRARDQGDTERMNRELARFNQERLEVLMDDRDRPPHEQRMPTDSALRERIQADYLGRSSVPSQRPAVRMEMEQVQRARAPAQ